MFRKDESHQRDRGSGRHQKDPQAPGIMGSQTPSPTQSDPTAKDARIQHRLFHFLALRLREAGPLGPAFHVP
jgi:hypothetical protein